jgi:hypothetical protein
MIVDSMTKEEIRQEYIADLPSIKRKTFYLHEALKCRRAIIQAKHFPLHFKPTEHISPRKNNYFISFVSTSKKDIKLGPIESDFLYYHRPEGIYAATIDYDCLCITIYSPHFFDRYRERYLKDTSIPKLEVIKEYFKYNSTIRRTRDRRLSDNGICGTGMHGAVLGIEESHEIHLFKTFVSFDMLKQDQTNTHDLLYDKLIDFWSEI